MKLSVYIPALRRDELFDRCLQSIHRSIAAAGPTALGADDYEICVIEGVTPVSAARNAGVERTTGEWIACVDSDDEVTEDWFAEICRAIQTAQAGAEPIDDIFFDVTIVTPSRTRTDSYGGTRSVIDGDDLCQDVLRDMRIGSHCWRHVLRRELFADQEFRELRSFEDYDTLPHLLRRVRKALYIAKPLYRYVTREGSLSRSNNMHELLEVARARMRTFGQPAEVGFCLSCFSCLYDRSGNAGELRGEIRRRLPSLLFDRHLSRKWRLKFLLAAFGVIVRLPK